MRQQEIGARVLGLVALVCAAQLARPQTARALTRPEEGDVPAPLAAKERENPEQNQEEDASSEDALKRELEAAAREDAAERSAAGEAQAPEPGGETRALGKELVGNEMNPALSLILDTVASRFSRERRLRLGGHAPESNGIALTGLELAASANVDPYFRFDLAFELAHLHLEEAYVSSLSLPWNLQARAGRFLSRIGRHNTTHPHSWSFVLPPLANQSLFGAEGLGAPGLEISWLSPLPWFLELTGAVQVGHAGSFRTKPLSQGDPSFEDLIYPLRLAQFFELSDDWALNLGLNTVLGTSALAPEAGNRSFAYGIDLLAKWRPIGAGKTGYTFVAWVAELWLREMEAPGALWRDAGGYLDLVFGLGKRWELALRGELWRRLDEHAPSAANGRAAFGLNAERASVALSFMPSHFSLIRPQVSIERAEGLGVNYVALLQLEVSAGAHGAHAY